MKQFIFERFPTWLIGAYGGVRDSKSATPTLDRLASRGLVFDSVFYTTSLANCPEPFDPGIADRCEEVDPSVVNWFSEATWTDLRAILISEGFGISDDMTVSEFVDAADADIVHEVFSDDFIFDFGPAAEFLIANQMARAAQADARLEAAVHSAGSEPFIVTAFSGGVPPTVADDQRLDGWRHLPLILVGENVSPGRCLELMDLSAAITRVANHSSPPSNAVSAQGGECLVFDNGDSIAVRDHHGLYSREQTDDCVRERFFIKPDDRWNQLNVASQQGDLLDRYRQLAFPDENSQ